METAASTSPFAALSKQAQHEKWHAWQSTHFEATELPQEAAFTPAGNLPPLKLPVPQHEPPALKESRYIPRRSQYDHVMNRMKKASENAKFVDM